MEKCLHSTRKMKWYGTNDDELGEYLKFHKIVRRCYNQAATSTAPELVDLVAPSVEEVRRGLRTRVDVQERKVMQNPGEAIWYKAERNLWYETVRILQEDDSVRECTLRACSELDLKKIPLMVLIKVIEPMGIFLPEEIAAAIRAQALLMYSQLQEKLEDLDVEEHDAHPHKPCTKRFQTYVSRPEWTDHQQNCNPVGEDSRLCQCYIIDDHSTRDKFSPGTNASSGKFGEMDDKTFTRKQGPSCIGSSDDEDDDFLCKYFTCNTILSEDESMYGSGSTTTPSEYESTYGSDNISNDISSEDETFYASGEPTYVITHISTDQECTDDEFESSFLVDSLGFDFDDRNSQSRVPCCYCYYS